MVVMVLYAFFWVVCFGLRVAGYGLRVTGFGFRVSGYGFRVTGIQKTDGRWRTASLRGGRTKASAFFSVVFSIASMCS